VAALTGKARRQTGPGPRLAIAASRIFISSPVSSGILSFDWPAPRLVRFTPARRSSVRGNAGLDAQTLITTQDDRVRFQTRRSSFATSSCSAALQAVLLRPRQAWRRRDEATRCPSNRSKQQHRNRNRERATWPPTRVQGGQCIATMQILRDVFLLGCSTSCAAAPSAGVASARRGDESRFSPDAHHDPRRPRPLPTPPNRRLLLPLA
jgi:hypothetical protein